MVDMTYEELVTLVADLNACLPIQLHEEGFASFSLHSTGYVCGVLFGDAPLWNDDTDDRLLDDNGEPILSVRDFVIERFQEFAAMCNAVDFTGD